MEGRKVEKGKKREEKFYFLKKSEEKREECTRFLLRSCWEKEEVHKKKR